MFAQVLDTFLPVETALLILSSSLLQSRKMKVQPLLIIGLVLAFFFTKASSSELKAQLRNSAYSNFKGKKQITLLYNFFMSSLLFLDVFVLYYGRKMNDAFKFSLKHFGYTHSKVRQIRQIWVSNNTA